MRIIYCKDRAHPVEWQLANKSTGRLIFLSDDLAISWLLMANAVLDYDIVDFQIC